MHLVITGEVLYIACLVNTPEASCSILRKRIGYLSVSPKNLLLKPINYNSLSRGILRTCFQIPGDGVVFIADPMRNVSWMLFPGRTELVTLVKTGSRAGRTHT